MFVCKNCDDKFDTHVIGTQIATCEICGERAECVDCVHKKHTERHFENLIVKMINEHHEDINECLLALYDVFDKDPRFKDKKQDASLACFIIGISAIVNGGKAANQRVAPEFQIKVGMPIEHVNTIGHIVQTAEAVSAFRLLYDQIWHGKGILEFPKNDVAN